MTDQNTWINAAISTARAGRSPLTLAVNIDICELVMAEAMRRQGPGDNTPYVPSWCYKSGPKMCPCGHHEGYHDDDGKCHLAHQCKCTGLPADCLTPLGEC
jgi:hypothetical protein